MTRILPKKIRNEKNYGVIFVHFSQRVKSDELSYFSESYQGLQLSRGDWCGVSTVRLSSQREVEVLDGLGCFRRQPGMDILTGVADIFPQQSGSNGFYGFISTDLCETITITLIKMTLSKKKKCGYYFCFFINKLYFISFTSKRPDSVMSECSSKTEVSKSMLVLLTTALLRPPPVRFAMTCSDSCRSCDSSGMSRRMKTTSNRDRRAEPILQSRRAASSCSSNSI